LRSDCVQVGNGLMNKVGYVKDERKDSGCNLRQGFDKGQTEDVTNQLRELRVSS